MDTIRFVQEPSLFLAMLDFHSMSLAQQKLVLLNLTIRASNPKLY